MTQQRWRLLALVLIAVIGISGLIEALPHASETVSDLMIDAAIVVGAMLVSLLIARLLGRRGGAAK